MDAMRLGLVLGRFQPLHPGHLAILKQAFAENDQIVVCIGSAQRAEPFTTAERHSRIEAQLQLLYPQRLWRIVDLVDPEPMEIWPQYVKETCAITDETVNTFYRADELPAQYRDALRTLGFTVTIVPRISFYYRAPDGLYYLVRSATEIKTLHERLKQPLR